MSPTDTRSHSTRNRICAPTGMSPRIIHHLHQRRVGHSECPKDCRFQMLLLIGGSQAVTLHDLRQHRYPRHIAMAVREPGSSGGNARQGGCLAPSASNHCRPRQTAWEESGAPGRIRTLDPQFRRLAVLATREPCRPAMSRGGSARPPAEAGHRRPSRGRSRGLHVGPVLATCSQHAATRAGPALSQFWPLGTNSEQIRNVLNSHGTQPELSVNA